MKKLFALFLALTLCLCCAAASATGLSGLGGGLPNLNGDSEALPDPAEVTEETGELLQSDYQFADDYLCDTYVYPRPQSTTDFIEDYTSVCRRAGYTVTQTTVDGENGYSIQSGDGLYALIVPSYQGQMLLLVQKGMTFTLQQRTNYATCVYNNRDYELEVSSTGDWASRNAYNIMFKAERAPFKYLTIYFPTYARSGDEFSVSGQIYIEGFEVSLDNDKWLVSSNESFSGKYRRDAIEGSKDFATLELYTVKDTEDGLLVEGCFNGRFDNGDTVFEDFVFSAILEL